MFRRHQHAGQACYGRGPFGGGGGGRGRHGHEGRGLRRFFDHGDLRLVILKLIGDEPSHGYDLIRSVEQAVGGAYSPSPGVVYPTLTLLEELGHVTGEAQPGGKKLYTITDEGRAYLDANARHVEQLLARMGEAAARSVVAAPSLVRAQENLRTALKLKLTSGALSAEQVEAIASVLDQAAVAVEKV